jgi:mono/diheme cytochrome c family protein
VAAADNHRLKRGVRHSRWATVVSTAGLLLASIPVVVAAREAWQAGAQAVSVWSGVYTNEQAIAGEKIYFDQCASCHGDDLAGRERAPALAGTQFLDAWHGKTLRRLLERIEEMPPGAPVSSAHAVELLAFLLYSSEMPSGSTRLPNEPARLGEMTFERAKP